MRTASIAFRGAGGIPDNEGDVPMIFQPFIAIVISLMTVFATVLGATAFLTRD
jgi:hypothetical protein